MTTNGPMSTTHIGRVSNAATTPISGMESNPFTTARKSTCPRLAGGRSPLPTVGRLSALLIQHPQDRRPIRPTSTPSSPGPARSGTAHSVRHPRAYRVGIASTTDSNEGDNDPVLDL